MLGIKRKSKLNAADVVIYLIIALLSFFFLYPVWYCLITSLSSGAAVKRQLPLVFPLDFTIEAYRWVFKGKDILTFYRNSVFYAVAGTFISLAFTAMMAYPFVIHDFIGKKALNVFMVITMFFSGGLLPYYFLISGMGWRNTVWVMLIPGAVSAFTVIIFRTFFNNVPHSLREAAYIDGAGHYRVLMQIIIPVSKPLLATFALFGMVGKWNDWFTPFLFMTKDALKPIQTYLREVLITQIGLETQYNIMHMEADNVLSLNLKTAIVIITIAPILCVYPFLQKYFASGIMVGSIKA